MPYIAPVDLIEAYGLQEVYELLSDEEGLISLQLVSDAVAGGPLDEYSNEQQDAIGAALIRVQRVIERQSQYIDSKLAARYALPLPEGAAENTPIVECCLALTRAALADDGDNLSTTMKEERTHWRKWLDEVKDGAAHLIGVQPFTTGGVASQRLTAPQPSGIDWARY